MPALTDSDRVRFLHDLDKSERVEVTDWEAKFIESNLDQEMFSPKQREIIDRMMRQYDQKL